MNDLYSLRPSSILHVGSSLTLPFGTKPGPESMTHYTYHCSFSLYIPVPLVLGDGAVFTSEIIIKEIVNTRMFVILTTEKSQCIQCSSDRVNDIVDQKDV